MSGPKVDRAELRRQQQEKLKKAREDRRNLFNTIQNKKIQMNNYFSHDLDVMKQDDSLRPVCERIKASWEKCDKELDKLLVQIKCGNEMLNIDKITHEMNEIIHDFDRETKSDIVLLNEMSKSSQKVQELEENRRQLEQIKKKKIARLSEAASEKEVTEVDIAEMVETFNKELTDFMSSKNMTSKHKNTMLLINQDLNEILNSSISGDRKEKRVKLLFKDFQKMAALAKKEAEEMQYIYEEYIKECFDSSLTPLRFSDFTSKKEIEEAIQTAKESAEKNISKEYIKRQIDEVMAKHGYDVLHSDMLSEAEQNGQILYGIDNSTAINVFVSDENQVTMRVVGVGFDTDISEAEGERLYNQQCAFCSMHPQITAELAMRGVVFHEKKHLPPDKKYNKKIQVNSRNNNQSMSRAKKELKRTELKTMRKGE